MKKSDRFRAAASLAAAALCLALPHGARAVEISFDQGVDASSLLNQGRIQAGQFPGSWPGPMSSITYSRDCTTFSFAPDAAPVSEERTLRSREWIRQCAGRDRWDTPPGPGNCTEFPGREYLERVQVSLRNRGPLLPWESDKIRVCLEGPWLTSDPFETAYEYRRVEENPRGHYIFEPVKKIPMRPDPNGIAAEPLTSKLILPLNDRWASSYQGETTVFHAYVRAETWGPFWQTVLDAHIRLPAASRYEIDFASLVNREGTAKMQAGKRYFIKYAFQRDGQVSSKDWIPNDGYLLMSDTGMVAYQP